MALKMVKGSIDRMFDKNLQDLVRGIRNHKEDEVSRRGAGLPGSSPQSMAPGPPWSLLLDPYRPACSGAAALHSPWPQFTPSSSCRLETDAVQKRLRCRICYNWGPLPKSPSFPLATTAVSKAQVCQVLQLGASVYLLGEDLAFQRASTDKCLGKGSPT